MCGIAGKWTFDPDAGMDQQVVSAMVGTMAHRGPDGEGVRVLPQIVLGHRRLAIIDLEAGDQPMTNEDGTVWITFNGEIYNFRELRANLLTRGHQFLTCSDTEVIVHLYEEFGEGCVEAATASMPEKLRGNDLRGLNGRNLPPQPQADMVDPIFAGNPVRVSQPDAVPSGF